MQQRERLKKTSIFLAGLLLTGLFLFPIYILVLNSFKTQKGIFLDILGLPGEFFTLANYPDALSRLSYLTAFKNSFLISVSSTGLILLFSAITAWVLVRSRTKFSAGVYLMFTISLLVPFQCVMLPLIRMLRGMNLLNPVGLVFCYVGFGASLAIMLFHGFIKNIPLELEEAATIDGAGKLRTFFSIVLPLLKTILVTVAILNIMWIWNDYLLPSLVVNARPEWHTLPLRTFLFFGQFSRRWDLGTAALVMGMLPIIIFYVIAQKHIVKGVTDGSIK